MLNRTVKDTMTPYEREQFEQERTVTEMQIAHTQALKDKEIALATLEAKWTSLLRIPALIVMLPVRILFGIAFICSMFTKRELDEKFWEFMSWKR